SAAAVRSPAFATARVIRRGSRRKPVTRSARGLDREKSAPPRPRRECYLSIRPLERMAFSGGMAGLAQAKGAGGGSSEELCDVTFLVCGFGEADHRFPGGIRGISDFPAHLPSYRLADQARISRTGIVHPGESGHEPPHATAPGLRPANRKAQCRFRRTAVPDL